MEDSIKESNYSKNDGTNESNNKKKIQTSSGIVTYQKLFNENYTFKKKLKTEKCFVKKILLIISLIIIAMTIIALIIIIKKNRNFSPKKNASFPINSFLNNYSVSEAISKNIGLSTGGAKDINNFRENIKNGFFPISTDITYNGLFYDYYFDTVGKQNQNTCFHHHILVPYQKTQYHIRMNTI